MRAGPIGSQGNIDHTSRTTAAAIAAVEAQATPRNVPRAANWPIARVLLATSTSIAMIGTAITPLATALQNGFGESSVGSPAPGRSAVAVLAGYGIRTGFWNQPARQRADVSDAS